MTPMVEFAKWYASQLRWPCFPVHGIVDGRCTCGRQDCEHPGKHPRTPRGFKDATADVGYLQGLFGASDSNVAVGTGALSGVVVIDVDRKGGIDGFETLANLVRTYGALPHTVVAKSGGGGEHYFFRHPGVATKVRSRTSMMPGLDSRGDGGYIVVPPSRHVSGGSYEWHPGRAPWETAIAELPNWVAGLIEGTLEKNPVPQRGAPASRRVGTPDEIQRAIDCLKRMPSKCADDYNDLIKV